MDGFDWDSGNKDKNWIKHKTTRRQAEQVFFDKGSVQFKDVVHSKIEARYIIIGKSKNKKCLHVAFTIRKNKVRIISARVANKKETKRYEENNKTNSKV